MWDVHRNIDAGFFAGERTVLLFEFSDYTSKFRRWWLVIRDGDVDVCLKDPGFQVNLHILTDLRTLTAVWMGDLGLGQALRQKLMTVTGESHLKRGMPTWLGSSYFADVKPADATG
jgi:hypothetical protein